MHRAWHGQLATARRPISGPGVDTADTSSGYRCGSCYRGRSTVLTRSRQDDGEDGSPTGAVSGRNRTAVLIGDTRHDREPESRSVTAARVIGLPETVEDVLDRLVRQARTSIGHLDPGPSVTMPDPKRDRRTGRRVSHRVRHQIRDCLTQMVAIAEDDDGFRRFEYHCSIRRNGADIAARVSGEDREVDRVTFDRSRLVETRQRE